MSGRVPAGTEPAIALTDAPTAAGPAAPGPAGGSSGDDLRAGYLDGLRALTALYVALFHAQMWRSDRRFAIAWLNWLPLNLGHAAVCIFIVLSGFCLTMSVARKGGAFPPFGSYIRRRARRILPPYYAALVFSLAMLWAREALRLGSQGDNQSLPVTPANVAAHLLLIHNWSTDWVGRINAPMWTIAVEWQLYFLLPLLIYALYGRGFALTLGACVLVGSGAHFLPGHPLDMTVPWYLALFVFGAGGAIVAFDPAPQFRSARDRIPWGPLLLVSLGVLFAARVALRRMIGIQGDANEAMRFAIDPLFGVVIAILLVWMARSRGAGPAAWLRRGLEWQPLVDIGLFSYSLYLLHGPILDVAGRLVIPHLPSASRDAAFAAMLCIMPALLAVSYGFHVVFERPFMRHGRDRQDPKKLVVVGPSAQPAAGSVSANGNGIGKGIDTDRYPRAAG